MVNYRDRDTNPLERNVRDSDEVSRESEMKLVLMKLSDAIAGVTSEFAMLSQKIQPVIKPELVGSDMEKVFDSEFGSPLAMSIDIQTSDLLRLLDIIINTRRRIEL